MIQRSAPPLAKIAGMTSNVTAVSYGPAMTPSGLEQLRSVFAAHGSAVQSEAAFGDDRYQVQVADLTLQDTTAAGLAQLRGGDSVENQVDANGIVEGNHAENITSGDNTLTGGAFGNATGINTVIQNSGSNVLIQNGMVVNVRFTPTP